jgi:hypothetical protein
VFINTAQWPPSWATLTHFTPSYTVFMTSDVA